MKKALVIAALILISNLATLIFSATNADNAEAKKVQAQWVEVDRISKIIEIEPLSSYYFQIKDSTIYENRLESMPVLDVLKRVPNWLRNDLETNLLQLVDIKTDVGNHAAPTLFDIDKDGDYDLVIGTLEGKLLVYENKNGYWLKKGLLNDSTGNPINVGAYAVAVFEDITGDSALDLVLGAYDGRLRVYENTTSGWEFKGYIQDVNGNIIDVGYNSAPAFGWIVYTTRVGDPSPPPDFKDMLIGAGDGKLYRYERTYDGWIRRGTLAPDSETEPPSEIEILDVGNYSKPALVDLNGDCAVWRADLSIGAGDGTLYHYWNTGNRTVTYYDPVDETWYKETRAVWSKNDSVYQYIEKCPYAAPALADLDRNSLMDNDCLIDLVVGREDGHIHIYKNLGTANNPRWDVWPEAASGVEVEHYMKDRNLSKLEKYLNLILDVENEYVDEIAFCLAHISPDVLTDKDVYPEVFKKNAELVYEIDKTIQYANLVEKGDYTTSNYWTTIEYNVSAGAGGAITKYELPRDIYYWFIVHPKITDELPTFINPETGGPAEPPTGKFWREYLFFHADDNYPPDPDVDDNNDGTPDNRYPKEDKPPLLKDKIAGITLLYDGVGYSKSQGYNPTTGYYDYPDPRTWEWSYENHPTGIEIVSNWVKRTLPLSEPESRDGERPIQPVRIAHHHNGNCGELQDLTVAAARTCLIPTAGVCLIGEDHVWSEFYCYDSSREYHWHQWDNQWGGQGGGSVIDNFDFLGSDRGGTGIFKWWGDDHITEVTPYYAQTAATVKITVNDTSGYPVDGARVLVSTYLVERPIGISFTVGYWVPGALVPCIWKYTDSNGICEFRLFGDFQIEIASKLGSATIVCTYVKNGNYTENVTLQDSLPNPYPKGSEGTVAENYHIDIIYTVACGEQIHPPVETTVFSIIEGKHFERVAAHIDFFTCSKREFQNYMSGKTYKYGAFRPNETSDTVLDSNLSEEGFIVFSNDDCVESKKIINVTIVLKKYRAWQSTLTISSIEQSGSTIWVNGTADSVFGIDSVWVKLDDETWRLANGTNTWTYNLSITRYYLGTHTIYARARDSWGEHYYALNSTDFDFENQLVDITITYPQAYKMINNTVEVSGKAIDPEGSRVEKIEVKLADRAWEPVKEEDRENHNWSITLNTEAFDNVKAVDDGEQKIWVKAFDGILYSVRSVLVIVDNNLPNISITTPSSGEKLWGRVQIEGDAFDVNEVKNIWLELNHTEREDSTRIDVQITQGESVHWDYLLDTTQFHEGIYNLSACAFDGLHTNLINITVIIDNNKPPEILYSPVNATIVIEENSTQEFRIIDAKDPENRGLTKYWYLQKKQITGEFSDWQNITDQTLSDSSIYLFKADYTSSGEYRIKVVVSDIYYYNNTKASSENTTQIWNLIVMNVNRIPQILAYTPLEPELVINELASLEFAIDCIDIDNDTIFMNWSVNDILRYSSKIAPSTFIFNTDYKSSGDYIVEVNVSDCYDYILIKWLVKVKNVNRAPTAIFLPMLLTGEYLNITAPKYQTFVIESLSDEDDDNLTIVWRVNGEVIVHAKNATHYPHLFTEGGLWNVSVEIFDGETRILNYWLVNVYVEPSPTPPTFELGIAACAVLTAILIILSIKKLRKKS